MQLAPATPAPIDFTALKEVEAAYDVNYLAGQLARRRAHYAFLFQRYQDMLTLDDEGFSVSITLKSDTKTVTLDATESEESFDLSDIYKLLGSQLGRLQAEIISLLESKEKGTHGLHGLWEGTDAPIMRQVVALCMPQPTTQPAADSTAPVTPTAEAA